MQFLAKKTSSTIAIVPLNADTLPAWLKKQPKTVQSWVTAAGYVAAKGALLSLPDENGEVSCILFGAGSDDCMYTYADLPAKLPAHAGGYVIDKKMDAHRATQVALGWALGCYDFNAYRTSAPKTFASLVWPEKADKAHVLSSARAMYLVRDLVNTPANDLGPAEIAKAVRRVAETAGKKGGARVSIIEGEALLKQNYPAIYAVGKGSPRAPRLIDMRWGKDKHMAVTLVGKGVAFDTGGLNLKPGQAMALMKKDMGGAAHVLAVAQMIMEANLPVRLRVLIPAVENSMDGNSFRPSDIIDTRKGLKVEVGDTDAEGRLILCDALAEACREEPALIVDFATLTGAARVALGPDLPAMFANTDKTANALLAASARVQDPLWRLPLWQPYRQMLKSKIADTNNIGGSFAGAITAALYLEKFIDHGQDWVHIDTYAWNPAPHAGRPEGGEALGMRAVFELVKTLCKK